MLSIENIQAIQHGFAETRKNSQVFAVSPVALPDHAKVTEIISLLRSLLFPNYYPPESALQRPIITTEAAMISLTASALKEQIRLALSCRNDLSGSLEEREELASQITRHFMMDLPEIQQALAYDIEAIFEGDPAARSLAEIIFSYPSLFAIMVHRLAHRLWLDGVPLLPRIMSEYAHRETGIDIHPGSQIGKAFCIDHGTGVVIGETAVIGDHVKIYQGVTLGALSLAEGRGLTDVKRHPTVEDHVTLYANSTVLGGETTIGANSIIGGGAFITRSVPRCTKVIVEASALNLKRIPGNCLDEEFPGVSGC